MEYRVMWCIDLEADSPEHAARLAREIQEDPESLANVFRVAPTADSKAITIVDLNQREESGS